MPPPTLVLGLFKISCTAKPKSGEKFLWLLMSVTLLTCGVLRPRIHNLSSFANAEARYFEREQYYLNANMESFNDIIECTLLLANW
jgi:hypothetical protein